MKKMRWLRWVALFLGGAMLLLFAFRWAANEVRPTGSSGPLADSLALQMQAALGGNAWDETGAVAFTFRGNREHLWDRDRNLARILWNDYEVLVNLDTRQGLAWKKGKALEGKQAEKAVEKGWETWVNDAFWLSAPFKAFDPGVTRSVVPLRDGTSALMVSYSSGGSTPGDAYLWILGPDNVPVAWKMWVSILPIGGLKVPFDQWTTTSTGVTLPTGHSGWISLNLTNVQTAKTLPELVPGSDPFAPLLAAE